MARLFEVVMAGSWKSLNWVPSFSPGTLLLTTHGSVLMHDNGSRDWYLLAADRRGRYDTPEATWSGPFAMTHARQLFDAAVLEDGRVVVSGGAASCSRGQARAAEIFDPRTQTWAAIDDEAVSRFARVSRSVAQDREGLSDAGFAMGERGRAVPLPGGNALFVGGSIVHAAAGSANCWSNLSTVYVFDPATERVSRLTSQPPTHGAGTWQSRLLLLPTGQVLMSTERLRKLCLLVDPAVIGRPPPSLRPVITTVAPLMALGCRYKLSARGLGGPRAGDVDAPGPGVDLPIVKLTHANDRVFYVRTCAVTVAAAADGVRSALLEIPDSVTPGPCLLEVIVDGIASDPLPTQIVAAVPAIGVELQDDLVFGASNAPRVLQVRVCNLGHADLVITHMARTLGSAAFEVLPHHVMPVTIGPGGQGDFSVCFDPIGRGVPTLRGVALCATLRIASNDPVKPVLEVTARGRFGMEPREASATADEDSYRPALAPVELPAAVHENSSPEYLSSPQHPG